MFHARTESLEQIKLPVVSSDLKPFGQTWFSLVGVWGCRLTQRFVTQFGFLARIKSVLFELPCRNVLPWLPKTKSKAHFLLVQSKVEHLGGKRKSSAVQCRGSHGQPLVFPTTFLTHPQFSLTFFLFVSFFFLFLVVFFSLFCLFFALGPSKQQEAKAVI